MSPGELSERQELIRDWCQVVLNELRSTDYNPAFIRQVEGMAKHLDPRRYEPNYGLYLIDCQTPAPGSIEQELSHLEYQYNRMVKKNRLRQGPVQISARIEDAEQWKLAEIANFTPVPGVEDAWMARLRRISMSDALAQDTLTDEEKRSIKRAYVRKQRRQERRRSLLFMIPGLTLLVGIMALGVFFSLQYRHYTVSMARVYGLSSYGEYPRVNYPWTSEGIRNEIKGIVLLVAAALCILAVHGTCRFMQLFQKEKRWDPFLILYVIYALAAAAPLMPLFPGDIPYTRTFQAREAPLPKKPLQPFLKK